MTRDDALARLERVAVAWWRSRRPPEFTLHSHLEDPAINCTTEVDKQLARAVAARVKESVARRRPRSTTRLR